MSEVLYVTKSVTLDASGRGSDRMGPVMRGEVWHINRMTTNGNSATDPTLKVYRGQESPQNLIDSSIIANQDISPAQGANTILNDNEYVTFVYEGGTIGAIMNFRVEGDIERRHGRSYGV